MKIIINIDTEKSIKRSVLNEQILQFIRNINYLGIETNHETVVIDEGKAFINKKALQK